MTITLRISTPTPVTRLLAGLVRSILIGLCALFAGSSLCATPAGDLVAIPRATSLLVDQAGLLTGVERGAIEARLKRIQDSGRAQVGVLISTGTGAEALAPYALRVAEAWQLGSKEDATGLLILVVPSQHAARIEVGYGLEGPIPDARASGFVRDYLRLTQPGSAAVERPGSQAIALNALLDNIDQALPSKSNVPRALTQFVRQHAEWKIPIVMLVFSVFTLFPLLFTAVFGSTSFMSHGGRSLRALPTARIIVTAGFSAALFAGALGFAALTFWDSTAIGYRAAAIVFPLPLLWSLNTCEYTRMHPLVRVGSIVGNLSLFAYCFSLLTVAGTAAMYVENVKEIWAAPLFGALFAAGVLALMAGGPMGEWMRRLVFYYIYFLVALALAYFALQGILKDPTRTAVTVAAVFAVLLAIGFTLDDREKAASAGKRERRWAWMFGVAAVLFILPFMLLAFVHALLGDSFTTHFAMLMAGDGTFSQFVWWASGALGGSALLVGLGGAFGGGGAESS